MPHRTMQGREIDLEKLMRQNELMPAIGNMKVNARGDELGPGGRIVKKREDIIAEYYEENPNAVATISEMSDVKDQKNTVVKSSKKEIK